ncbi:MAG: hypothetical protein H6825_06860 [Planctomycetes bacterium]|nr:hypothetical protein [Planctomycetota bacterium]
MKNCGSQSTQSGISLFWGLITFGAQTTTQQDLKQWCCSYVPSDDGPTGSTNVPECQ